MEIWKDVKDYEGHYQVSNLGRVKALYREFIGKDGKLKKYSERILLWDISSRGTTSYARVTLSKDYITNRMQVHRIVAEHFIANTGNKECVNHIDNNGLNNTLENLEWVTHSENMLHAQRQGRLTQAQSSGGKKGSAVNIQKMLANFQLIVNTQIGGYLVKSINGRNIRGKVTLLVQCVHCSNDYTRTYEYICNYPQQGCIKCKHKVKI